MLIACVNEKPRKDPTRVSPHTASYDIHVLSLSKEKNTQHSVIVYT